MAGKKIVKGSKASKLVVDLPPDVTMSDTKWSGLGALGASAKRDELGIGYDSGFHGAFTFYKTERFGWVLCTLPISKGRRGTNQTDRTYGIAVRDEGLVTVGKGPHVLATVTVWLSEKNFERLMKYVELWKKGMAKAGDTRDRISTRRANTIAYRNGFGIW